MDAIDYAPLPRSGRNSPAWRGFVLGAIVVVILCLCWLMVWPFLPAFSWAFALAVAAHPVHAWLRQKLPGRHLPALLCLFLVAVVLLIPGAFLVQRLVDEASHGVVKLRQPQQFERLQALLDSHPGLAAAYNWAAARVDLGNEAGRLTAAVASWTSAFASSLFTGSVRAITQLILMLFALFYFLRDGDLILHNLRKLIPLGEAQVDRVFERISETIHASLYGKVVVASIQGLLGGLMFWLLGLPAPVFWGFIMALLSIVPVLGSFVIWAPAALALALQGSWGKTITLLIWGVLVVHPIDNILFPALVGSTLQLNGLLIFVSVVGGMIAFGPAGIVLGPVTLAVAIALFDIWQSQSEAFR